MGQRTCRVKDPRATGSLVEVQFPRSRKTGDAEDGRYVQRRLIERKILTGLGGGSAERTQLGGDTKLIGDRLGG